MLVSMIAQDPYPGRLFQDAYKILRERFPKEDIKHNPVGGDVFISLPLKEGGSFRAVLTWQQAKYFAYSELTGDDLKHGQLPPHWPKLRR